MALFEVGKEYWLHYGTAEEQESASVKVLEVDGTWLRIESDKLDSLINVASPMYMAARERDRESEARAMDNFRPRDKPSA